jgi:hypothetical protein
LQKRPADRLPPFRLAAALAQTVHPQLQRLFPASSLFCCNPICVHPQLQLLVPAPIHDTLQLSDCSLRCGPLPCQHFLLFLQFDFQRIALALQLLKITAEMLLALLPLSRMLKEDMAVILSG